MANQNGLLVIERLLRDRDAVWRQIIEERDLRGLTGQMLASSAISLALYGAVLGASNSWMQALSSLIKLPLLFLATLAICLPTLYLFNLVFGARLSVRQALALVLVAVTVNATMTSASDCRMDSRAPKTRLNRYSVGRQMASVTRKSSGSFTAEVRAIRTPWNEPSTAP